MLFFCNEHSLTYTYSKHIFYAVFQKELYNGIPNVTVWRVSRTRLDLKEYNTLKDGYFLRL
jgi:hypothetical protein